MVDNLVNNGVVLSAGICILIFLGVAAPCLFKLLKQELSLLKFLGIVGGTLVVLGVLFTLKNYKTLGEKASNITENAIEGTAEEIEGLF